MRRAPTLWAADPAAQRGKSEPSRSAVFEPSHGVFRAESLSESRRFSSRVPFRVTALFVSQTLFGPTIVARLGDHRGGQQLGDQGARTKARTRSPRAQRALISACAGGLMQAADRGRAVLPSSAPPSLPTHPPRSTPTSQLTLFPTGSGDGPGHRCDTAGGHAAGKRGAAALPGRVAGRGRETSAWTARAVLPSTIDSDSRHPRGQSVLLNIPPGVVRLRPRSWE